MIMACFYNRKNSQNRCTGDTHRRSAEQSAILYTRLHVPTTQLYLHPFRKPTSIRKLHVRKNLVKKNGGCRPHYSCLSSSMQASSSSLLVSINMCLYVCHGAWDVCACMYVNQFYIQKDIHVCIKWIKWRTEAAELLFSFVYSLSIDSCQSWMRLCMCVCVCIYIYIYIYIYICIYICIISIIRIHRNRNWFALLYYPTVSVCLTILPRLQGWTIALYGSTGVTLFH